MDKVTYNIIESSGYGIDFRRAIYVLFESGYILNNGIFIGGKSLEGDFSILDIDEFVEAFYIALIGDHTPPKPFIKKVLELYKLAIIKIK